MHGYVRDDVKVALNGNLANDIDAVVRAIAWRAVQSHPLDTLRVSASDSLVALRARLNEASNPSSLAIAGTARLIQLTAEYLLHYYSEIADRDIWRLQRSHAQRIGIAFNPDREYARLHQLIEDLEELVVPDYLQRLRDLVSGYLTYL